MSTDRFLPIQVSMLAPATAIGIDLYQIHADTQCPVLFRGAAYPMDLDDIANLCQRGISCLYISEDARGDYQTHLRKLAEGDGGGVHVGMAARLAALTEVVRDVVGSSFEQDETDAIVVAAHDLGALVCSLVRHRDFAADALLRTLYHDPALSTRSANVAVYAAVLANSLAFEPRDVARIAAGALLHDLGMLATPAAILKKPARLNAAETAIVRRHPLDGFRRIADRDDVCYGQAMMVYQHHERLNGSGYPVGIVGDEIHPWARLCAVVDVFESLTSDRPHRKAMPLSEAIQLLRRDAGTTFDPEMVACWTAIIQTVSTDSSARSSGRFASRTTGANFSASGASAVPTSATSASTNA